MDVLYYALSGEGHTNRGLGLFYFKVCHYREQERLFEERLRLVGDKSELERRSYFSSSESGCEKGTARVWAPIHFK